MFPVPAVTIPLFPKPLRNEQIAISRKFPAVQSALRDFSACRWEHKREEKNYEKGDCVLRMRKHYESHPERLKRNKNAIL